MLYFPMKASVVLVVLLLGLVALPTKGLMLPSDYPFRILKQTPLNVFRILEQTPLNVPKDMETLGLSRVDWKETSQAHVISVEVPGMKREHIKIEVEEKRVLRITGERESEEVVEGEKWHRAERTSGKFCRQFRLPASADMDSVEAHLEDGVLRVTVPKLAEEKREPRVVNIVEGSNKQGGDIKASKADM